VKGRAHMLWRELGAQYAQPGARNAFSLACIILRARVVPEDITPELDDPEFEVRLTIALMQGDAQF